MYEVSSLYCMYPITHFAVHYFISTFIYHIMVLYIYLWHFQNPYFYFSYIYIYMLHYPLAFFNNEESIHHQFIHVTLRDLLYVEHNIRITKRVQSLMWKPNCGTFVIMYLLMHFIKTLKHLNHDLHIAWNLQIYILK